jgi:peptidoglycan/LPS O-acetylase OafA/YrhL
MSEKRLDALDGLRGVAILLVMGFHYFYHLESAYYKSHLYPYGEQFAAIPLFQYGYLGVELFFIISGFFIALTLEKSHSPLEFLLRRFVRIWPALLFSAVVTFVLLNLSDSPFALTRRQEWPNFLPSLTLTPTILWSSAFPHVDFVTGVYWSLVVEIRFYIIAAILFWALPSKNFARNLTIFALADSFIWLLLRVVSPGSSELYNTAFVPEFMPWFAAGALFYELYQNRISQHFAFVTLVAIFIPICITSTHYAIISRNPLIASAIAILFLAVFWLLIAKDGHVKVLQSKPLVWIGQCSYSIYLFHYAVGMILISSISKSIGLFAQVSLALGASLLVLLLGRMSFRLVENPSRRILTKLLINRSPKPIATVSPSAG